MTLSFAYDEHELENLSSVGSTVRSQSPLLESSIYNENLVPTLSSYSYLDGIKIAAPTSSSESTENASPICTSKNPLEKYESLLYHNPGIHSSSRFKSEADNPAGEEHAVTPSSGNSRLNQPSNPIGVVNKYADNRTHHTTSSSGTLRNHFTSKSLTEDIPFNKSLLRRKAAAADRMSHSISPTYSRTPSPASSLTPVSHPPRSFSSSLQVVSSPIDTPEKVKRRHVGTNRSKRKNKSATKVRGAPDDDVDVRILEIRHVSGGSARVLEVEDKYHDIDFSQQSYADCVTYIRRGPRSLHTFAHHLSTAVKRDITLNPFVSQSGSPAASTQASPSCSIDTPNVCLKTPQPMRLAAVVVSSTPAPACSVLSTQTSTAYKESTPADSSPEPIAEPAAVFLDLSTPWQQMSWPNEATFRGTPVVDPLKKSLLRSLPSIQRECVPTIATVPATLSKFPITTNPAAEHITTTTSLDGQQNLSNLLSPSFSSPSSKCCPRDQLARSYVNKTLAPDLPNPTTKQIINVYNQWPPPECLPSEAKTSDCKCGSTPPKQGKQINREAVEQDAGKTSAFEGLHVGELPAMGNRESNEASSLRNYMLSRRNFVKTPRQMEPLSVSSRSVSPSLLPPVKLRQPSLPPQASCGGIHYNKRQVSYPAATPRLGPVDSRLASLESWRSWKCQGSAKHLNSLPLSVPRTVSSATFVRQQPQNPLAPSPTHMEGSCSLPVTSNQLLSIERNSHPITSGSNRRASSIPSLPRAATIKLFPFSTRKGPDHTRIFNTTLKEILPSETRFLRPSTVPISRPVPRGLLRSTHQFVQATTTNTGGSLVSSHLHVTTTVEHVSATTITEPSSPAAATNYVKYFIMNSPCSEMKLFDLSV